MGKRYEYKTINVSQEPPLYDSINNMLRPTIETAANRWAQKGWRTVAVMPSQGPGYADAILIEREVALKAIAFEDYGKTRFLDPDDVTYVFTSEEQGYA